MKKSLFFAMGLFSITALAQSNPYQGRVGINTETPSATLNVKSKTGTTSSTKNLELENANGKKLLTIQDDGHIGIGTTPSADAKLVISNEDNRNNTTLQILDGGEFNGAVLTSNSAGLARWAPAPARNSYYQSFTASVDTDTIINSKVSIPGISTYRAAEEGYYQVIYHSFLKYKDPTGMASYYFSVHRGDERLVNDEVYAYTEQEGWINTHYSTVVYLKNSDIIEFKISPRPENGRFLNLEMTKDFAHRNKVEVIYLGVR